MWKIIRSLIDAFLAWLELRRKQKKEAREREEAERRRLEEEARRETERIGDEVDSVPRPELDSDEDSDDPMGVDSWNRNR